MTETLYMLALLFLGPSDPQNNSIVFFYSDKAACVAEETRRNKNGITDTLTEHTGGPQWRCLEFYCGLGSKVTVSQSAWKERGVPRRTGCIDSRLKH